MNIEGWGSDPHRKRKMDLSPPISWICERKNGLNALLLFVKIHVWTNFATEMPQLAPRLNWHRWSPGLGNTLDRKQKHAGSSLKACKESSNKAHRFCFSAILSKVGLFSKMRCPGQAVGFEKQDFVSVLMSWTETNGEQKRRHESWRQELQKCGGSTA